MKPCKTCGRDTFRAEQFSVRTEPLRCVKCQLVTGRCRCAALDMVRDDDDAAGGSSFRGLLPAGATTSSEEDRP